MKKIDVFPAELKIRYKGFFDWGGLYRLVYNWIINRKFRYHEKRYKDKIDTALGNEIEVETWGEKEITEYYQYKVEVNYHLWESREVPVVIKGKEVMMMRGRIDIKIKGTLITDWQKRYDSDNNLRHKLMEMFLNKVILKNEIEMKYIDPFDKDLHALEGEIKKFLKIEADTISV